MHALSWEARYRKRASGQDVGNSFLAELDTLDGDFAEALASLGIKRGRLLEIGAGLGTQAVQYARLGFDVTATEVSDTAIEQASALAANMKTNVTFVNDNILFSRLSGPYDVIVDRGCYTILPGDLLGDYARNVSRLLAKDGILLLKVDKKNLATVETMQGHLALVSTTFSHYRKDGRNLDGRPTNAVFAVLRHMTDPSPKAIGI